MTRLKLASYVVLVLLARAIEGQEINWNNMNSNSRHVLGLCAGMDYSSYYGLTYGYHFKNFRLPVAIGVEVNVPFGSNLFDDWVLRTGLQSEIFKTEYWTGTIKADIINRNYNSEIAKIYNIGGDLETVICYYRKRWGIATEINYDRSVSSKIKHGELKNYYPEIKDGWYNTGGGNFKFALRGNCQLWCTDFFLTIGKIYGQDFSDNPTLPFFVKLSSQWIF